MKMQQTINSTAHMTAMELPMRATIITTLLFGLLGISNLAFSKGEYKALEKAIEAEQFQMLNATGNGLILARECKTCPEIRLNVTAATQAFYNHKLVPLSSVPTVTTSVITVFYDPKTLNAKRISW
jgi:hypothetical protein